MRNVLPAPLAEAVSQQLREADDQTPLESVQPVGGGDINRAACIQTQQDQYFLKWHHAPPDRFFECEAQGLTLLNESGAVNVPGVVGIGKTGKTGFLLLEWVETSRGKSAHAAEKLGQHLAQLHLQDQPPYGLDHDNYIGRLPQPNRQSDSWVDFYRTERLGAQRELAQRQGRLPDHRAKRLDIIMNRLDEWIDEEECKPSLLHGDLWGGNWMVDAAGEPVIIDPAVYVGDREADLAMTALFGGFPESFYSAYNEVYPVSPGYMERQPLYKLYYLLCHLNLFGEGYGGSVDSILRQYAG